MAHKERLALEDTFMDVMTKMSEGNPGALTVLGKIMKYGRNIAKAEPLMWFMLLDRYEIYASDIWKLYKDVCGESLINLMVLLDYVRIGRMSIHDVRQSIAMPNTSPIDFNAIKTNHQHIDKFNMEAAHGLYK